MHCTAISKDRVKQVNPFDLFKYLTLTLLATAISLGFSLYPSTGQAQVVNDVSDRVHVEFDQVKNKWRKKKYNATVVVTNTSLSEIHGPLQLIITEFKNKRHSLDSADGINDDGHSYIEIELPNGILGVGESSDATAVVFSKMGKKSWRKWKKANRDLLVTNNNADEPPGWSEHDFPIKFNYRVLGDVPPVVLTISEPDAAPGALQVGTGTVGVRFTVSALTTADQPISTVLLRQLNTNRADSELNDDGINGDLLAGDGIYSLLEMIDTDALESGECLTFIGVGKSDGGDTVESEETLLCASHLPTEIFETEPGESKFAAFGEATVIGNELLVRFEPGKSIGDFEEFLGTLGGAIIGTQLEDGLYQIFFDKVYRGEELEELFALFAQQDGVLGVDPNYVGEYDSEPADPEFPNQHALKLISANSLDTEDRRYVWDAGATGAGTTVLILDSGVNDNLPDDLDPLGELAADTNDLLGHGTQMAGIVAAPVDNETAIAAMARDTQIRSVRLSKTSIITLTKMLKGFKRVKGYAGRNTVVSASFSIRNMLSDGGICNQINKIINRGAVVVVSAGNHDRSRDTGVLPAHCNSRAFNPFNTNGRVTNANKASLIVVGASACTAGPCDVETRWTESGRLGSNFGDWVDISAPGVDVQATSIDGLVTTTTGTSPATALVAGAAAILRSCDVGGSLSATDPTGATLGLSLGDVFQAMLDGATTPVPDLPNRLNLYNALASVNTPPNGITLSNDEIVENTDTTGGFILAELGGLDDTVCDSHEFEITGGADAASFSIGGDENNMLVIDDGVLDFESRPSYEVEISVHDFYGETLSQTFTIVVIDQIEIP